MKKVSFLFISFLFVLIGLMFYGCAPFEQTSSLEEIKGISFEYQEFVYDGLSHKIEIKGSLPEGVSVNYTNNDKTEAGSYEVVAKFLDNTGNYNNLTDLKAILVINNPLITVKFNADNNQTETIEDQKIVKGQKAVEPSKPVKDNYVFLGWFNGDSKWSFTNNVVNEEITLVAKWDLALKLKQINLGYEVIGLNASTVSVNIPSEIDGKKIISIGNSAFVNCTKLKNVVIPGTITNIGTSVFKGCSALESLTVPYIGNNSKDTTNTYLGYFFGATKYEENATLVPASLKNVTIESGEYIYQYAFSGCANIENITLLKDFKEIKAAHVISARSFKVLKCRIV